MFRIGMLKYILPICSLIGLYVGLSGCKQSTSESESSAPVQEAAYVGDEACASCHEETYVSFHQTGMGRSVSEFNAETAPEQFEGNTEIYNERFDYYYQPLLVGDSLYQREYRKDDAGEVVYEQIHAADWVIGSGNATRSYLMNVNGHVTQMPLTWYVGKKRWDMSPAYTQQNFRFSREIGQECMTCHNGVSEYSDFTQGHYTKVDLGITCERCHGPGSEHADLRLAGIDPPQGAPDPSIVNPGRLDRELQLSVCQQCHLTGVSVFKPGEDMTTFRPGEPLADHRKVFVPEEQLTDPERFGIASHAQRLARSACYQESAMTCITCHNPHQTVQHLEDDYFNTACQSCHENASDTPNLCSREGTDTPAEAMTGNCVSCHLQKSGTTDIPHVTFTDHWIRRTLPPSKPPEAIERERVVTTVANLVPVESEAVPEDPQMMLEEAIAYFRYYETHHKLPEYLNRVVVRARQGLALGGEHVEGRLALGRALIELDSLQAARSVLTIAAGQYPQHARILYWLGSVELMLEAPDQGVESLKRAVAIAPEFNEARLKLADGLMQADRLQEAETALLDLLDRNPVHHPEAWNNLGMLYLRTERPDEALPLFERAIELNPDLVTSWANAGAVLLMQSEIDLAETKFQEALRLDPYFVPAMGNLAMIYWQKEERFKARDLFSRLLSLEPNDQRARALLQQLEQEM